MTMLRIHHTAVNVSDWERSVTFYRDILGFELLYEGESTGTEVDAGVRLTGVRRRFAFLRLGDGMLELIHYITPAGHPYDRKVNDTGNLHMALQVADVDKTYERLRTQGVQFMAPPRRVESGPLRGCASAYFLDPDGVIVELFEQSASPQT